MTAVNFIPYLLDLFSPKLQMIQEHTIQHTDQGYNVCIKKDNYGQCSTIWPSLTK